MQTLIGGSKMLLQWRSVVSSVPQSRCSSVPGLLDTGCWEQITFEGWFSLWLIFSKEAVKSAFKGIRIKWDHCWHVQNKNGLSCWVVFDGPERILECINEYIVNIGTMRWFCLYVEYSLKSAFIIQSLFLKYPWKYIYIYIYTYIYIYMCVCVCILRVAFLLVYGGLGGFCLIWLCLLRWQYSDQEYRVRVQLLLCPLPASWPRLSYFTFLMLQFPHP